MASTEKKDVSTETFDAEAETSKEAYAQAQKYNWPISVVMDNPEAAKAAYPKKGTADPMTDEEVEASERAIFVEGAQKNQERTRKLLNFTRSSTKAALIMLAAAVVAVIVANSPLYPPFLEFWETDVGFIVGGYEAELTLAEVINDIFMAIFFLLVGLEIKYEMTVGELTNIRQALLPILAACGGVAAPAIIYTIINMGNPSTFMGWGVPTATDIAFALGIMSLLGNRVPNGVKVFLSTLAVADDIIAILVIAIFYGQSPSPFWLGMAAVVFIVLMILNRTHIYSLVPYIIGGIILWYCVFCSGVHSTISGVILAFTIPSGSRVNLRSFVSWSGGKVRRARDLFDETQPVIAQQEYMRTVNTLSQVARQVVPPATRLEQKLYPWVYFGILPLFALTNADVCLSGVDFGTMVSNTALLGVFFGLLLGKPIGILTASFIIVKTKLASLPTNTNWIHMVGAGILGGVGFTMAIFVANLAYTDPEMVTMAKAGILTASTLAGVIGFMFLFIQAKSAQKKGISYITMTYADAALQTAAAESDLESAQILENYESSELRDTIKAIKLENPGITEIVIDEGDSDIPAAHKVVLAPKEGVDEREVSVPPADEADSAPSEE